MSLKDVEQTLSFLRDMITLFPTDELDRVQADMQDFMIDEEALQEYSSFDRDIPNLKNLIRVLRKAKNLLAKDGKVDKIFNDEKFTQKDLEDWYDAYVRMQNSLLQMGVDARKELAKMEEEEQQEKVAKIEAMIEEGKKREAEAEAEAKEKEKSES